MATQMSKAHSSAVGCDFLSSYESAPAMRGNKVPRYGKGVTPSGAAHCPKILRVGDREIEKNQGRDMVEGEKREGSMTPGEGIADGQ